MELDLLGKSSGQATGLASLNIKSTTLVQECEKSKIVLHFHVNFTWYSNKEKAKNRNGKRAETLLHPNGA